MWIALLSRLDCVEAVHEHISHCAAETAGYHGLADISAAIRPMMLCAIYELIRRPSLLFFLIAPHLHRL